MTTTKKLRCISAVTSYMTLDIPYISLGLWLVSHFENEEQSGSTINKTVNNKNKIILLKWYIKTEVIFNVILTSLFHIGPLDNTFTSFCLTCCVWMFNVY